MPPEIRAAGRRLRVAVVLLLLGAMAACSDSSDPPEASSSSRAASSTSTTRPAPTTSDPGGAPSRVSVWGDSLSLQAHDSLREQGRGHGLAVAVNAFFGLAPCDVARDLLKDIETAPDALVIAFTGNNLSPCMERQGERLTGSAYYAAYRKDVGDLVAAAVARDIPVLVVGAPAFPARRNVPDRVELNRVLREVAEAHPGARYVDTTADVSPDGFTNTLPCLPGETVVLGCSAGLITVRAGNGVHFDEPRAVPCLDPRDTCRYTAGGHRFANAIYAALAEVEGLSYVPAAPTVGVPSINR